jgi:MEDS: MEthanogen/methylotroph, DcmR Sensory domain
MTAGTHLCLIYDDEQERREVVAKFVESGLSEGERVAYFTDAEPLAIRTWLGGHGFELPEPPVFSLLEARNVYFPDGEFLPERMPPYWRAFHREATDLGFPAARATGETSWSREVPGGDRIVEYEANLNAVLVDLPVTALCQYDVRRFDGATIFDILRVHPLMLVGGQVVRNPYYERPEEFLERSVRRE